MYLKSWPQKRNWSPSARISSEPVDIRECVMDCEGPTACRGARARVDRHGPAGAGDPSTGHIEEAKIGNECELGQTGRIGERSDDAGVLS